MTKSEGEKLKPCPFCGGETLDKEKGKVFPCFPFRINHKKDCFLYVGVSKAMGKKEREAWNRRYDD